MRQTEQPFDQEEAQSGALVVDPLTPEKRQLHTELKAGVNRVLDCFALKDGEHLLIVTDTGVDPLYRDTLWETGRERTSKNCRMLVVPRSTQSAQKFEEQYFKEGKYNPFEHADAVLMVTSFSRSHSSGGPQETMHPKFNAASIQSRLDAPQASARYQTLREKGYTPEKLKELLEGLPQSLANKMGRVIGEFASRTRIISITNNDMNILLEGAALEEGHVTNSRIERFAEIAKDVVRVRVTSVQGTNLDLQLEPGTLDRDTPIVDKPGKLVNYPMGEWAWSVDLAQTNGVYVCDGAVGENIGRLDEPITLTIKDGKAVDIQGGSQAEALKAKLMEGQEKWAKNEDEKEDWRPADIHNLAEFAIGMNAKAFRYTPDGKKISPPTSLEAEKGLGTTHIALGANHFFHCPPDDPDYNNIDRHIDFVAMTPTVTGICADGTEIELVRDGDVVCLKE